MGTKPASKESRRWRDGVYFVPVIEPGQTGHVGHGASGARFRNVRVGVMA